MTLRVKFYIHAPSGAASNWWTRSPNTSNSTNFIYVNTSGTNNNNNASNTYGVCLGLCERSANIRRGYVRHSNPQKGANTVHLQRESLHPVSEYETKISAVAVIKTTASPDTAARTLLAWSGMCVTPISWAVCYGAIFALYKVLYGRKFIFYE